MFKSVGVEDNNSNFRPSIASWRRRWSQRLTMWSSASRTKWTDALVVIVAVYVNFPIPVLAPKLTEKVLGAVQVLEETWTGISIRIVRRKDTDIR